MQAKRPERFFRPSKICDLLCISRSYCYFLISSGQLEGVYFGSGKGEHRRGLRVSESSLERFIDRMKNGA
jgi:hypothetical protein